MSADSILSGAVEQFATLVEAAGAADVPLLLVFDAFENIQRHGVPAVDAVWRLVELLQPAFPQLRTVFVGRAPIEGHPTRELRIEEFSEEVACAFLRAELGDPSTEEELVSWAIRRVGRVPLALKLAVEVLRREGPEGLRNVRRRRLWVLRLDEMQVEGLLYRRILDHIEDPDLRRIANPGLMLRRITPDVIRKVLAKPCGLKVQDDEAERRLFEALKMEASLVTEAEEGAALHHRPDVRRVMLGMFRQDDPRKLDQIHKQAVAYYRGQAGTIARAEELYHRLSLGQSPSTLDEHWDDAVCPYLEGALDELPPRGQAYLADKLGVTIDPEIIQEVDDETWRRQTARHVSQLIPLGRQDDALGLLRRRRGPDGRSLIPLLEARVLRLRGDIEGAREVAEAGIEAAVEGRDPVAAAELSGLAAEMAEAMGDLEGALATIEASDLLAIKNEDPTSSLARMVIEYRLRRKMGMIESPGIQSLRDRILSQVRGLPRQRFEEHPALLRDLASEFAGEDLQIASEAVRVVGLSAERERAIDLLAPALDRWEQALAESGQPEEILRDLARVEGEGVDAWRMWLSSRHQIEWAREIQRLIREYPVATAPIQSALEQVYGGPYPPRVVGIRADGSYGSGYLIGEWHVLTARDVVGASGGTAAQVRSLGKQTWIPTHLIWEDESLDLALLEITDSRWEPPTAEPARWGWVLGAKSIECTVVGFPPTQTRPEDSHELEQIVAAIEPLKSLKSGRLAITINDSGALLQRAGMAGAAVFAAGRLVGVVTTNLPAVAKGRIGATPISLAVRNARFAALVGQGGTDASLEPVPVVAGLRSPWRLPTRRGASSPARLLRAENSVVAFRGRERELSEAVAWCLQGASPVRLLTGPAGTGKTRLALELCGQMAGRGWVTALLAEQVPDDAIARVRELRQPTLLVVDYAELRRNLGQLLRPLASTDRRTQVRVLLLARGAGDWWTKLKLSAAQGQKLLEEEPHPLAPVDVNVLDRETAFVEAASAFAAVQGMPLGPLTIPELRGPEFDAILHVHMAALDAVGTPEEPGSGPGAGQRMPVLRAILDREARYWVRSARARGLHHSQRALRRVLAVGSLLGADDEDEAVEMLLRVPDLKDASEGELVARTRRRTLEDPRLPVPRPPSTACSKLSTAATC